MAPGPPLEVAPPPGMSSPEPLDAPLGSDPLPCAGRRRTAAGVLRALHRSGLPDRARGGLARACGSVVRDTAAVGAVTRRSSAAARRPAGLHGGQRRCLERSLPEALERRAGVGRRGQAVLRPQRARRGRRRPWLRGSGQPRGPGARARDSKQHGETGDQRGEQRELSTPRLQAHASEREAGGDRCAAVVQRQRAEPARVGDGAGRGLELQRGRHPSAQREIAIEQAGRRRGSGSMCKADREYDQSSDRAGQEPDAGTTPAHRQRCDLQRAGSADPDERGAPHQREQSPPLDPALPAPHAEGDGADSNGRAGLARADSGNIACVGRDPAQCSRSAGGPPSLTPRHAAHRTPPELFPAKRKLTFRVTLRW